MPENETKNNSTNLVKKIRSGVKKIRSGIQWLKPLLPELLIAIGALSLLYSATHTYLRNRALRMDETMVAQYTQQPQARHSQPAHITIPQLIDIPIQEEVYDNGNWTISETTASYLSQSARPGESGNIIIYGHNKRDILGNLRVLGGNEIVTVTTKDGVEHQYQVKEIAEVEADEVRYLQPTDQETLTIYTCSGFMDKQRFIVRAEPLDA